MFSVPEVSACVSKRRTNINVFHLFASLFRYFFSPLIEFIVFMCQRHMWFNMKNKQSSVHAFKREKWYAAHIQTNNDLVFAEQVCEWNEIYISRKTYFIASRRSKIKDKIWDNGMYFSFRVEISFILNMRQHKITKNAMKWGELWHFIYFIDGMICNKFKRQKERLWTKVLRVQTYHHNVRLQDVNIEVFIQGSRLTLHESRIMIIVIIVVNYSFSLTWKE